MFAPLIAAAVALPLVATVALAVSVLQASEQRGADGRPPAGDCVEALARFIAFPRVRGRRVMSNCHIVTGCLPESLSVLIRLIEKRRQESLLLSNGQQCVDACNEGGPQRRRCTRPAARGGMADERQVIERLSRQRSNVRHNPPIDAALVQRLDLYLLPLRAIEKDADPSAGRAAAAVSRSGRFPPDALDHVPG